MKLDVKQHRESLREQHEPEPEPAPQPKHGISRRAFLGGTGALVVGIAVPRLARPASAVAAPPAPLMPPPPEGPNQMLVDSWLTVHGDGTVTIFTGRAELGTGTTTSTLQIAADELDVALDRLSIVEPDTHLTADQTYTAGSQTTKTQWAMGVRGAAIQARAQLLELASQRFGGVPPAQLTVDNGVISGAGRTVTYAELIGNRHFDARINPRARGKSASQLKVVGQSVPRIDIPGKVTGTFPYVQDVVLPGMLHARMVRPPTIDSELLDVNDAAVLRMPGIVRVAVKGNRIGVIAHTEQQAIDGMQALMPRWRIAPLPPMSQLYDDIRGANPHSRRILVETLVDSRGAPQAIREASKQLSATYLYPYQLHGTLGASCAVADITPRSGTVYSPTQGVYPLRDAIATAVGLDRNSVHVIYVEGSGCYGLNAADSVTLDAALMSAAAGAPVRVQYMRADEHTTENFGQPMVMEASAGLDDNGKIVGWNYNSYQGSRGARPGPPGNVTAGGIAGFPAAPQMPSPPPEPPLGPDSSNAVAQYEVPHMRVVSLTVPSRFFTGQLRSPTRIQNTFANESFIDELSVMAGKDPIDFRLEHLNDPRLLAVIRAVRTRSKWKTGVAHSSPGGNDRVREGIGMAAVQYEGTEAYVAVVVHVSVDMGSGQVRVLHVWAAQDCGITINPDGMRAQAEGCVVQGMSRALREEVRWSATSMESIDWVTYPILTFSELPQSFDFHIIDRPDIAPVGAGEVVITVTPAAIANAIFDATGARLRQIPMTPERVRAALRTV